MIWVFIILFFILGVLSVISPRFIWHAAKILWFLSPGDYGQPWGDDKKPQEKTLKTLRFCGIGYLVVALILWIYSFFS